MPSYKTPDVYIEEISVFPPSVAQVETAIPAFIGYTEQAIDKAVNDLVLKPTKIYSLKEYERYYGFPKADTIALTVVNDSIAGFAVSSFTEPALQYLLYYSVKMFFDNGGGQCYIIAVGTYQNTPAIDLQGDNSTNLATMYGLQDGLEALALEDEPTLIVIPEAVELTATAYQSLVQAVLLQCNRLGDRFAIFDIFDGDRNLNTNQLSTNRDYFGNNYLKYGAAYYPFLRTTMNFYVNSGESNVSVTPPPGSGAIATSTLSIGGIITSFNVTNGGTGYTSTPTISFTGGGGATATAVVSAAGVITGITVNNGGTGYTSPPTVVISGGGGSGAIATATVSATGVITSFTVTNGGTGYTSTPTISFTGGGGATATAVVSAAGVITGITVSNGGTGYTSQPTVVITGGGGGSGGTATATISAAGVITSFNVTNGGTGYTSTPTISFTGGGGATATAILSGGAIASITVNSGGTGYTSPPTVVITGGGGSGAIATAAVASGAITSFNVTNGGTGYTSAPTISFTGGGGAAATATVTAGVITAINVTNGGSGYTSPPTVVITSAAPVAAPLASYQNQNTGLYNFVKNALKERFVVLPPSGAVTGIYAATDSNRGVWKAPANISLTNVIEPVIKLDNTRQDDLNVDATTGKSINAIRTFMGKGTLVWGARTLAGNDNEWRYIPVRRFFNMVEESVKKSTYWAVFEPNDANTWVKVRGMIENFLNQQWREGALAGATPKDAFFVKCGLGITMTSQDILEGRMNVEIGMAVVRPAEFIILKFSHKLQTS